MRRQICSLLVVALVLGGVAHAKQDDKDKKQPDAKADPKAKPEVKSLDVLTFAGSKLPKRIEEAPAIISVFDRSYLTTYGFLTLNELLRTTPGFDVRTASWFDTPATRGISTASLLMVDATPLNSHLTNLFPANFAVDLTNYRRIEIMSGPGGVLWGPHSLLGVINLISLNGSDVDGVHARAELGSFGHQRYGLKAGGVWKGLDGFFAATFTTRRGANVSLENPTAQTLFIGGKYQGMAGGRTENKSDYFVDLTGKLTYKKLTLFARVPFSRAHYQASEEGGLLRYGDNGYRQSDDWLAYVQFLDNYLDGNLTLLAKGYFYRNVLVFDQRLWTETPRYPRGFGYFVDQGTALKFGGIAEGTWKRPIGSVVTNTLIAGVDVFGETISGATISIADEAGYYGPPRPFIADKTSFTVSPYAADEIAFLDRVALSFGARYNYSDSYRNRVLLAGSVVVRPFGRNYLKVKIAQGLRPPTMGNRFGLEPLAAPLGDYQNRNSARDPIQAAGSTAYEFELNSRILENVGPIRSFFLRGDFAITIVDRITQAIPTPFNPGVLYYLPQVNRNILSAEARTDMTFRNEINLWASYAFTRVSFQEDRPGTVPQSGPRHAISLGGSARFLHYFSVMARATTELGVVASLLNLDASATGGEPLLQTADPVVYLSAGLSVDRIFRDLTISVLGNNLANQKYSNYVFNNIFANTVGNDGQALRYIQPGISVMVLAQMSIL